MSQIVLSSTTSPTDQYDPSGSPWSANNAAWNAGSLINGVDYTQSITINSSTFPNGTDIAFSWPSVNQIHSFPEIVYGSTLFLINPYVPSTQVASFANLSASYSITLSGATSNFDTIFDLWLTSQKNGGPTDRQFELEIIAHKTFSLPASDIAYHLTDSTLTNAAVYVIPGYGSAPDVWTNISVMPSSDILSGTINISDILKSLIWNGVITGQEYLSGSEFGPETGAGAGSLLVNSLSYQWSPNPTEKLAVGNNTFVVTNVGGNDIFGNGGVDTVIYSGAYSQYQIKHSGSELLVMENNNISTVDVLNGVTSIQFSNGTYNIATSNFTPTSASGPNAINDLITELYVGYYNRAPDPAGETYWVGQLQGGLSLSQIAQSYSVLTEFTAFYPFLANPNTSSTAAIDSFIAAIYENLFGRAPDAAGQTYYVQQLQNGQNTVGGTIIAIESGAQANDLLVIANKLTVGDYFDTQIFNNSVQFSQSVALAALAAVTASASSVTTAEALVNTYVATAPHAVAASQAEVGLVGESPSHDHAI